MFAFIIAFPLICIYIFGWLNKWFYYAVIICVIVLLVLAMQKKFIYQDDILTNVIYNGKVSEVIVAPFQVWLTWAKHPFSNIITSFAFLFCFILVKFFYYKKDIEVIYSLMLLVISLLVFFLLAESGPRFKHGNFYWQIPISLLIVNMVFIKKILFFPFKESSLILSLRRLFIQNKLIMLFYSMQFISGIVYLVNIVVKKNYF